MTEKPKTLYLLAKEGSRAPVLVKSMRMFDNIEQLIYTATFEIDESLTWEARWSYWKIYTGPADGSESMKLMPMKERKQHGLV